MFRWRCWAFFLRISCLLSAPWTAQVESNGFALGYGSPRLRNDHDVCVAAVARDPMALEFASTERRADRKVPRAAAAGQGCRFRAK